MLLDIVTGTHLIALPLLLVGLCLLLYGKEILEILSFPIGALTGGVLAYMILRGFLAPYDLSLIFEVIIAAALVFIGGLMGAGTMVMVVAFLVSLASVDAANVFLGEGYEMVSWILGALIFAIILYPVQKFLHFSSAAAGGILVAMSIFIIIDGVDPVIRTGIQLAIIVISCVGGGLLQKWLEKKIQSAREEITWVPATSRS